MPKSSSSVKIELKFFFPSLVAGVVTWFFSQDLMLGFEVFVVVLIIQFIARWIYK